MKLYTLTEEHRAQLKPWADKWIANGMSTKPMDDEDRDAMRKAVKGMYEAANLTPPPENRIVFVPSPFVLKFAAGFASAIWYLRKNKKTNVDAATYAATDDATRAATDDATYDATRAATYAATDAATYDATYAATYDATRAATYDATYDATDDATYAATYDAKNKKPKNSNSWFSFDASAMASLSVSLKLGEFGLKCVGQAWRMYQGGNFWSGWAAYLSFFRHVAKLEIDYSKWDHWEKATIHGSFRVMHPDFCMVSDRPRKLLVDEQNRPHCFDGPYMEWSDGSALFAIHGVRVPQWIPLTPKNEFTKEMILSETNVDNRRCIIQKIGIDRAIEILGAEAVDIYESPVGGKYELLSIDYDGRGNKRPYLKMNSKSIDAAHIEGVEAKATSVQHAIMFRNKLKVFVEPQFLS